jgi:hypothetical protein
MPDDGIDRDPDRILDRVCHAHAADAATATPPTDTADCQVRDTAIDIFEMLYVEGLDPKARVQRLAAENQIWHRGHNVGPTEPDWTWLEESKIDPDEYTYKEEITVRRGQEDQMDGATDDE